MTRGPPGQQAGLLAWRRAGPAQSLAPWPARPRTSGFAETALRACAVAGFEIKAGPRIKDPDLSGLRLLRDRLGDRFVGGFVLNLGELSYRKEDRIAIMPLCALWSLPR